MSEASTLEGTNYQKLLGPDRSSVDEFIRPLRQSNSPIRRWRWSLVVVTTFLIASLIYWWLQPTTQRITSWIDCGFTPEEARGNNCIYEPMQRSWIPKACHFEEPGDEYHPFDDRQWFYDTNRTQVLDQHDLEKLRKGENFTAYTHFFHHEHCLYAWRKLAIAVERKLPLIDSKTADAAHSHHCARKIAKELFEVGMDRFENDGLPHYTTSPLMFQTCVKLEWR
jgi:hypothetical protein